MTFFFFFSSRRRHTRWNCDWSSDVCSSDLDTVRERGEPGESLDELRQLMDGEEDPAQQEEWRDQEPADQGKTRVRSLRRGERKDRRAKGEAGQDGDDDGQQSQHG